MMDFQKPRMSRLEYQMWMQLFINWKLDILTTALPRLVVSADGQLMETYYDPESTQRLRDIDTIIELWQNEFGDPLRGMYVSIDGSFSG